MFNIAVLTSGMSRGSNLQTMFDYFSGQGVPVRICFVVITKSDAPVKEICEARQIPCHYIPYKSSDYFEEKILYLSRYHNINLIALAGFLKKLSPQFLRDLSTPVLNIHPALLPGFGGKGMYGMAVHKAVFDSGAKQSGITIHLVDSVYDHGKVIRQVPIDITNCHSPEEIASKVLTIEHQHYGPAIWEYLQTIYS
jgi:phosphoribosylglycinamide formyltransferase 1